MKKKQKMHGFFARRTLKVVVFGLSLIWTTSSILFVCICLFTVLQGLAPLATIWISKCVLDAIVDAVSANGNRAELIITFRMIALQLGILLSIALLNRASEYMKSYMSHRLELRIGSDIFKKLAAISLISFEQPKLYDILMRARSEAQGRPLTLINKLSSIVQVGITFTSLGYIIFRFNTSIFVVMLLLCMPYFIAHTRLSKLLYEIYYHRTHDSRWASYFSNIIADKRYVSEIASFGLWDFMHHRWLHLSKRFVNEDMAYARKKTLAESSIEISLHAGRAVITGYIIYIGVTKIPRLTPGQIMMYVGAFSRGLTSLGGVLEKVTGIYETSLFLNNLLEFHEVETQIPEESVGIPFPDKVDSIEIQNVSFRYPGRQEDALRNVNLTINNPESLLIVGCNGVGKTTLIKLITGLYEPDEGRILLNGIDLREYDANSLRRNIGVVFQDFIRYALSAKENIGCGNIEAIDDISRIKKSAVLAGVDQFIEQLPHKYETILSKQFKDGQELSVGQWQRLCLARLFMKDSPIIILDEPTASIDCESEANLLREIARTSSSKICLLVSHRMFRSDIADRIVVLENGTVIEQGTHDELISHQGRYAELCSFYHGKNVFSNYVQTI